MGKERNPVGWFEIPVTDIGRAKDFYEYVLGLELEEHQMGPLDVAQFPIQNMGIGAAGSLVRGGGYKPSLQGVLVYFSAPDIEATLSRAQDKGGQVIAGKNSIGEYGFIALIQDTEGNRIGLHSRE